MSRTLPPLRRNPPQANFIAGVGVCSAVIGMAQFLTAAALGFPHSLSAFGQEGIALGAFGLLFATAGFFYNRIERRIGRHDSGGVSRG